MIICPIKLSMCGVYSSTTFYEIFSQHGYLMNETLANIIAPDTIGGKIRKLRQSLNITQLQFAKSIRRRFGTVTKWEQELTIPSDKAIDDIIRIYGLEDNYFDN